MVFPYGEDEDRACGFWSLEGALEDANNLDSDGEEEEEDEIPEQNEETEE
jgi:hypothetical protein